MFVSFSLSVNSEAPRLNRSLDKASAMMQSSMERLGSGKKINSASDDAAGFAISEKMTSQIVGLNRAANNINDGLSLIKAAQATTKEVTDIVQRMRELTVQALSDLNSDRDKKNIQTELEALIDEVEKIGAQTKFNGRGVHRETAYSIQTGINDGDQLHFFTNYISPSLMGTAGASVKSFTNIGGSVTFNVNSQDWINESHKFSAGDIVLLFSGDPKKPMTGSSFFVSGVADNSDGSQALNIYPLPNGSLQSSDEELLSSGSAVIVTVAEHGNPTIQNGGSKSLANLDITDSTTTATAMVTIDSSLRNLYNSAIRLGAIENRLQFSVDNILNVAEATTMARSHIQDADFAQESARLAKSMVLRESASAMLSQAQVNSELVLALLKDVM